MVTKIHRAGLGLVAAGAMVLAAGCDQAAEYRTQVQATWEVMKAACENGDGAAAAKAYTDGTFEHYGRLVKLAVDGKAEEVFVAGPSAVLEIANMRVKSTRKQLEGLDGRGYVSFAVSQGWWAESLNDTAIKDIKVSGDFGDATLYYPELEKEYRAEKFANSFSRRRRWRNVEKPPEYPVKFVRQADGWKFDEMSMLPHWDREISEMAGAERKSIRDWVVMELEDETGQEISPKIWEPMKK